MIEPIARGTVVVVTKPGDRHEGKRGTVYAWSWYSRPRDTPTYELLLNGEHGCGRYDYEHGDFEAAR